MMGQTMKNGAIGMDNWSAGDWSGAFAGLVAVLIALGKGLAWLVDWNRAGLTARDTRLQRWEESLVAREKAYREEIESQLEATRTELNRVEGRLSAMTAVLAEVTAELRHHVSDSPALTRAIAALERMKTPCN